MMNRKKLLTNSILIIIILAFLGYYFFFLRNPEGKGVSRRSGGLTNKSGQRPADSPLENGGVIQGSGSPEILVETSFDGITVASKRIFRDIGNRNLFTPLIPPPPPPKPKERGVHEMTINWVLEEIISPTEVIVTDTRRAPHTVTTGDEISGIKIGRIESTANRVELLYKEEAKWLVLQDIETVTRGWKLEGVSPDTAEAYVFIEKSGGSLTLSEGTTFDHIRLDKVRDDGIVLKYGTQTRMVKMAGM